MVQSHLFIPFSCCTALGFYHMHSVPERDNYVTVYWNNIIPNQRHHFYKFPDRSQVSDFYMPYDFNSIMHLPHNAFSANGHPTILPNVNFHIYLKNIDVHFD